MYSVACTVHFYNKESDQHTKTKLKNLQKNMIRNVRKTLSGNLLFALSMRNVSLLMRAAAMKVTRLITPLSWPATSLEGRAASKSPHSKFVCFLSISQQGVSADIIQNSAVGNFSPKTEGTKLKAARC
jgi:hypothetical protein